MPIAPLSERGAGLRAARRDRAAGRCRSDARDVAVADRRAGALQRLLGSPDLARKRWIWEQYDHMVDGRHGARPGRRRGGGARPRHRRGPRADHRLHAALLLRRPVEGGRQAVAEAWRNLTAVGARPLALTDCLNFGNPEKPGDHGPVRRLHRGHGRGLPRARLPGRVRQRLALQRDRRPARSCRRPTIGGLGVIDDLGQPSTSPTGPGWRWSWSARRFGWLGQSLYLREICGREDGRAAAGRSGAERRNGDFVRALIARGRSAACHDLADGGLLVALAEMVLAGDIGADARALPEERPAGWLFGEDQGRYLLAVAPSGRRCSRGRGRGGVLARAGRHHRRARVDARPAAMPYPGRACRAHEGWLPGLHGRAPRRRDEDRTHGDDRRRDRALIRAGLPDAEVTIEDLAGDGDHYARPRRVRGVSRQKPGPAAPDGLPGAAAGAWAASCMPWR